jgi:hypothetical protein
MTELLGEYAMVIYTHPLRGERLNIGVIVWHPWQRPVWRFISNVGRVREIDENADISRVRAELASIEALLEEWRDASSPLARLHAEFRYKVVVTSPRPARISDAAWTLERLTSTVLPASTYARRSSAKQFARSFTKLIIDELHRLNVADVQRNVTEERTFDPIQIDIAYVHADRYVLWRTNSFSSVHKLNDQLGLAKAIHAENSQLRTVADYHDAELNVAIQLPQPHERADWHRVWHWIDASASRAFAFEDRESVSQKLPALLGAD